MTNHSWTNEERNHNNAYLGNSTMTQPAASSEMKNHSGVALNWTPEEQAILEDGLARYSSETIISRYAKIAFELTDKTIRDVALRCRWILRKESNKRRKEDHNGSGTRVDNKEIIDMVVASKSVPHQFPPAHLLEEDDGITEILVKQNEQLLNQISANFTSLRIAENLSLFYTGLENMRELVKNLNENVPELMKNMPPLPERLRDDLLDSLILLASNRFN